MFIIINDGQAIKETNYWRGKYAAAGFFYLTWNAGAGRLLVPDSQTHALVEMASARSVVVSAGPWVEQGGRPAIELLFEDGSDSPFCLHLVQEQVDRVLPATDQGGGFIISAWTCSGGEQGRWPGKFRQVSSIDRSLMSNHPNRGPKGPQSNPAPADIRAARKAAGLTQTQAGEMVHSSCRAWQQWESGDRRMHPATWALFLIRSSTDDERRAAFIAWRGEQPPPQALEDAWMAACAWIDQTG